MTQAFNLSQLANNVNSSGLLNAAAGLYNQTPVTNGGTGVASVASGAILIGAGTSAMTALSGTSPGQAVAWNGTAWVAGVVGGAAPIVTIYTSPSPWTKSPTLKAIKVTIVAGGGGASFSPTGTAPGGGGAAGYLFLQAPSIPGPVTVTVGTGGTAVPGPGATAPSGTPSSFGALATATGGAGVTAGAGGLGGSMSTTPTIFASRGQTGNNNVGGGNAGFGFGLGALSPVTSAVQNGVGYGFGGRGFQGASNPGICAGGAGIVVVEEFY